MRKKVISASLFGAIMLASVGSFVSCKDYDDKINNLQEQINAEDATLTSELNSTKSALEEKLKEVKSSYETQIAEAKAALQTAVNQKADEATVALLTDRVTQFQQSLDAAKAALETQIAAITRDIDNINAALAQKVTVSELNGYKAQAAVDLAAVRGDVDNLAKRIEEIAQKSNQSVESVIQSLKEIQSKIDGHVESLSEADKKLAAEILSNYQDLLAKIAEAKAQADTEAAGKISLEEAARIAAVNGLQMQIEALMELQGADKSELNEKIEGIKSDLSLLLGRISANEMDVALIKQELSGINDKLNELNDQINILNVLIEKSLTSLVYKPVQYMYGFGTINVQSFSGCATLSKKEVTHESLGKIVEYEVGEGIPVPSTWAPTAHAKYHMNPSTADYTKYDFSFADVETVNVLTRANDYKSIGATAGLTKAENGILDVEVKIKYPENLNDAVASFRKDWFDTDGDGTSDDYTYTASRAWVSTLALQATEKGKDKVVTSDYALVVPSYYGNLKLANNKAADKHSTGDNKSGHIRTCAVETINDALVTFEVPYNESLDLAQRIETHYGVSATEKGEKQGDNVFSAEDFAETGLTYDYSLVSYKTSARADQSVIAHIDADGVITIDGNDAKYIGETFVARILLQDGNSKNVAVGYVKILVVDQGAEAAKVTTGIVLNCENPTSATADMDEFVTQFKENYSSSLAIADFKDSKYALDATVYSGKGTNPTTFGKGSFKLEGNKIVLDLTSAEAKELFYKDDVVTPKTITVYAKFAHLNDGYSDLWVEFVIDKDQIVYAQGTFTDANKIKSYWYKENSTTPAAPGEYKEIHANVKVPEYNEPGNTANLPTFHFNALNTFVGAKATITGIDERLTAFTIDPNADLTISPINHGKEVMGASSTPDAPVVYVLVVKDDTKTLAAYRKDDASKTEQPIVVLSDTYNGIVNFQDNDYAKDILNYKAHNQLAAGETFSVAIKMVQNRNCYNVELDTNDFTIKFLRPINILDIPAKPTVDAVHGGGFWNVQDLVEFTDWRDYKFDAYGSQYYTYYGVQKTSIKPRYMEGDKIKNARTNINGNDDDMLADVAPGIELTWDPSALNSKIDGRIGYVNNGATVNTEFKIWVPIQVNYLWGTIYTQVELRVSPTIHNRRK